MEDFGFIKAKRETNARLKEHIKKLEAEKLALQEFAIWMTGCGYDFCQHEYFCQQRDKLLKEQDNVNN